MMNGIASIADFRDDSALVHAALAGDLLAKEALYRRYVDMACSLTVRLMGRDTDMEDVVQDSFAYAFSNLHKLRRPQAFSAWLSSVVSGATIALLRRRRLLGKLGLRRPEPPSIDTLIAETAPPDVVAELRDVYRVLNDLPAEERVVLVLRRVDELRLEEIADVLGMSLATVKRRLARATAILQKGLGQKGLEKARP
jgi:RNA polymerase sigma-70 factor (ECF subfamily)